ncbi:lipase family protein [Dietzia aerolata]|uniref:Lipase family protein n=1 Tax=Dietzia aerolata TaxID=595984 RepID=A0ABV5JQG5_9ACTN
MRTLGAGAGAEDRGRVPTVVGASAALAAVALGAALILLPLALPVIVTLAGVGLVVVGLATVVGADGTGRHPTSARIAVGVALTAAGIVVLVWRTASIRTLLWVMVAALVVHGIHTLVAALRPGTDGRVAGVFSGAAAIVLGLLCVAWPVLAIELVRYAVGAWLVFVGIRGLVGLVWRGGHGSPPTAPGSGSGPAPGRRRGRTVVAGVAFVVAAGLAVGSAFLLHGDGRPAPNAFYTPVEPLPGEPGVLLRAETLGAGVPDGADGWRILYTTTDPDGTVVAASGTVVAPSGRGTDALPMLSIAHGTTGIVPRCAPSLSPTPFVDGAAAALEQMVTVHGWAGVTSDYVGLGTSGPHQYLVGQAEARNVLDASRAAAQIDGLELSADTVVWGHSQGGHGALWSGQIAGDYAPELTIRGVVGMAPATDLFALAEATKDEVAGKTVSAYIASSWNEVYPQLDLAGHLNPGTAHGVGEIADLCFNEQDVIAALLRGSQIPEQVFPDAVLDGDLGATLRENSPTGPWPAPVLVAQGLADPLVKPSMQQSWVDGRCAAGEPIDYRTYPGLDHMGLVAADSPLTPQLVEWTLARWSGQAPTPTC